MSDFDEVGDLRRQIEKLNARIDHMDEQYSDGMAMMIARANIMARWISGATELNGVDVANAVTTTLGDATWINQPNRMNGGVA